MKIELTDKPIAKYRAWDIRNSKMVYDALVLTETRQLVTVNADYFNSPFSFFDGCKWMQWTGRVDFRGVEIYAGDNVRVSLSNGDILTLAVEWDNSKSRFQLKGENLSILPDDVELVDIEVVGNIYENVAVSG